tara:strand:+ start:118 stop:987 length:870 start_codon:yes stop_codon:yes gene_type:complete
MSKYTSFNNKKSFNNQTETSMFSTEKKLVMGILNLTNDSFYDGGKYKNKHEIINQVKKMLDEGADIIDIGAQSTRPGAQAISAEKELDSLIPTIKLLKKTFPDIIISIDTYWSKVARESVNIGADIINDISAGELDAEMFDTIASLQVPYIIMHMKGNPQNMQLNPEYKNVIDEIVLFFKEKIEKLEQKGVKNIIIDPGFGFGKTIKNNFKLLNNLMEFRKLKKPILIGISRKSMIYNLLNQEPKDALNGTSIANTIALVNGANILRVHDVKEAVECLKITNFTLKEKQ